LNRAKVFPTGVGMNRRFMSVTSVTISVPHRRGDEPPCQAYICLF